MLRERLDVPNVRVDALRAALQPNLLGLFHKTGRQADRPVQRVQRGGKVQAVAGADVVVVRM